MRLVIAVMSEVQISALSAIRYKTDFEDRDGEKQFPYNRREMKQMDSTNQMEFTEKTLHPQTRVVGFKC